VGVLSAGWYVFCSLYRGRINGSLLRREKKIVLTYKEGIHDNTFDSASGYNTRWGDISWSYPREQLQYRKVNSGEELSNMSGWEGREPDKCVCRKCGGDALYRECVIGECDLALWLRKHFPVKVEVVEHDQHVYHIWCPQCSSITTIKVQCGGYCGEQESKEQEESGREFRGGRTPVED